MHLTIAGQEHFENLYQKSSDPWGCDTRWYERRKRALLLATLPRESYRLAYEPACGNGALTVELARRCERVLASDMSTAAVALASARLTDAPHVRITQQDTPSEWLPDGSPCDLIVVSELGYYLDERALMLLACRIAATLEEGGNLIACHWLGQSADRLYDSEKVHTFLGTGHGLRRIVTHKEEDFLIDLWRMERHSDGRDETA